MIHFIPPENFNPRFEIVSAYITTGAKFLLLHRHDHKSQGGKWGEPAGKIEPGEIPSEALVREIKEETGLEVKEADLKFFKKIYIRFQNEYDFVYHMFGLEFKEEPKITINTIEHQAHRFVTPEDALAMNLVTDNAPTIKLFFNLD